MTPYDGSEVTVTVADGVHTVACTYCDRDYWHPPVEVTLENVAQEIARSRRAQHGTPLGGAA